MSFVGINPETDQLGELEIFLIVNDKGDLYLIPWKESFSPQQYELKVRQRATEYLAEAVRRTSA